MSRPLSTSHATINRPLRIGYLALTDAAPLLVASHHGHFKKQGVAVTLTREIGWATIRDKIIFGELDAAHAPAPMLWSTALGIGSPACEVATGFVLNLHGNAITLSNRLWEQGVRDATSLRAEARRRHGESKLTFGVVFPFSSHHLMLRDWLQIAGIDADRDIRVVVVPPAQMFRNLSAATIDGFCVGEPWNSLAALEGVGWCPTWSAAHQPGHVEKVLMASARFLDEHAEAHAAIVRALSTAAAWCDNAANRPALARLLADTVFDGTPFAAVQAALLGRFDRGHGQIELVPNFHVFHEGGANCPSVDQATSLQTQLVRASLLKAADAAPGLAGRLFREDVYRGAIASVEGASA